MYRATIRRLIPTPYCKSCEETNTKLSVTYVSGADEASKLNTLIASKSLPDVFQVTTISDAEQIRDNGMAAELTEYLKDAENIQNELGSVLGDSQSTKMEKCILSLPAAKPYAQNMCIPYRLARLSIRKCRRTWIPLRRIVCIYI